MANDIMARRSRILPLHLPTDAVVAEEFKAGAAARPSPLTPSAPDDMILDIGPKSVEELTNALKTQTLVWNGPLGAFEIPPFDAGTVALAKEAARLTKEGTLLSVAGGGDTVAALNHAGVAEDFSHVSTAGGAFLEWMEGETLPGVAVLMDDHERHRPHSRLVSGDRGAGADDCRAPHNIAGPSYLQGGPRVAIIPLRAWIDCGDDAGARLASDQGRLEAVVALQWPQDRHRARVEGHPAPNTMSEIRARRAL